MRPTRLWLGVVVAAGLAACGGRGAIFLTVEGTGPSGVLKIPDEVDAVSVQVTSDEGAKALLDKQYTLGGEQRFPLTLGLEPGSQTGARVRIDITAFKGEVPVATANAKVAMNPQEVTSVTVRLVKE